MNRVLVVDDDRSIRESVRELLEDEGYVVAEAENGERALNELRATPDPQVVLLDYMMPKLDGLGVLHAVDADPALHDSHAFILVTATKPLPQELRRYVKSMRITVLGKPFEYDELLDAVAHSDHDEAQING